MQKIPATTAFPFSCTILSPYAINWIPAVPIMSPVRIRALIPTTQISGILMAAELSAGFARESLTAFSIPKISVYIPLSIKACTAG